MNDKSRFTVFLNEKGFVLRLDTWTGKTWTLYQLGDALKLTSEPGERDLSMAEFGWLEIREPEATALIMRAAIEKTKENGA